MKKGRIGPGRAALALTALAIGTLAPPTAAPTVERVVEPASQSTNQTPQSQTPATNQTQGKALVGGDGRRRRKEQRRNARRELRKKLGNPTARQFRLLRRALARGIRVDLQEGSR